MNRDEAGKSAMVDRVELERLKAAASQMEAELSRIAKRRDEIEAMLPIKEAFAEGKRVEALQANGDWYSSEVLSFNLPVDSYRIASDPSKRTRPLRPSDLPDHPWLRFGDNGPAVIVGAIDNVSIDILTTGQTVSLEALQKNGWQYAPSHKGPWMPCEVVESYQHESKNQTS